MQPDPAQRLCPPAQLPTTPGTRRTTPRRGHDRTLEQHALPFAQYFPVALTLETALLVVLTCYHRF